MPELRTRARRRNNNNIQAADPNPIAQPDSQAPVARPRRRTAAAPAAQTRRNRRQKNNVIGAADEIGNVVNDVAVNDAGAARVLREEAMDEYDSGGRSADKAPGAEEEGSTAPLPEKVFFLFLIYYYYYYCIYLLF